MFLSLILAVLSSEDGEIPVFPLLMESRLSNVPWVVVVKTPVFVEQTKVFVMSNVLVQSLEALVLLPPVILLETMSFKVPFIPVPKS